MATEIVLLTRDPEIGGNNWVLAFEMDNDSGTRTRSLTWGKGRTKIKGTSFVEVDADDKTFDEYVADRIRNNYVEQARLTINFPLPKIIAWFSKKVAPILKREFANPTSDDLDAFIRKMGL